MCARLVNGVCECFHRALCMCTIAFALLKHACSGIGTPCYDHFTFYTVAVCKRQVVKRPAVDKVANQGCSSIQGVSRSPET